MRKPFFGSVLGYSSAVLAIAGLAFYCVARIAFSIYYEHYGVSPESVGITFQGLLAQEASVVNVVLLVIAAAFFLRAGWLINFADADELDRQRKLELATSERDLVIRSVASGAASDVNEERRNLARLQSAIKDLESERTLTVRGGLRIRRRGVRWLVVGLLIFGLWGAGIITEAMMASTGQRTGQWFDPLQIDVLSVTTVRPLGASSSSSSLADDAGTGSLLFLGTSDTNYVLYDRNDTAIWLVPERSATLALRS